MKNETIKSREKFASLFEGIDISLVRTFFDAHGGEAVFDNEHDPLCGLIEVCDIILLGGDPHSESAKKFIGSIPHKNHPLHLFPNDPAWLPVLKGNFSGTVDVYTRHTMRFDQDRFERNRTEMKLPSGYSLERMQHSHYAPMLREPHTKDFCSFFHDENDFVDRAIGYCITYENRIVSGAGSFTVFETGIEIQIETHELHRRKGLARICATALLSECIERNIEPHWDAFDTVSRSLAERLGYVFVREYPAALLLF